MKTANAVVTLILICTVPGFSQPYFIELDLDGVTGNGPDLLGAAVSDYVDVDVWILGSGPGALSSNFTICNLDGALEFQGYASVDIGPPWTLTPPVDQGNGCVLIQATDFTFTAPMQFPYLQGVVTYHAAVDHAFAELTIDLDPVASGIFNTSFYTGGFDSFIGATVQVGSSAIEESQWGTIKGLFR